MYNSGVLHQNRFIFLTKFEASSKEYTVWKRLQKRSVILRKWEIQIAHQFNPLSLITAITTITTIQLIAGKKVLDICTRKSAAAGC